MVDVKNKDLIKRVYPLLNNNIKFEWVKGHDGFYFNELCDQITYS